MFGFYSKPLKKYCDQCGKRHKHEFIEIERKLLKKGRFEGLFWGAIFAWDFFEIIQKESLWRVSYKDKCLICGLQTDFQADLKKEIIFITFLNSLSRRGRRRVTTPFSETFKELFFLASLFLTIFYYLNYIL